MLGVLLLRANEVVSASELVDGLWGDRPPASGLKIVQGYVSGLRKVLGAEALVTQPPGYLVRLHDDDLDLARFRLLLQRAREAPPARASDLLSAALALWRGSLLADVELEGGVRHEIERLNDLHLSARIDRIEVDLALGRHSEVAGELEALVAAHRLHEHLRAQLMLALYRSGRQAEALAAYRDARRVLVDELGLEPGPELQRMQRAVLAQDPALDPPRGQVVATVAEAAPVRGLRHDGPSLSPLPELRSPSRRRRGMLVIGSSLAVGVAIAAVWQARLSGPSDAPDAISANSVGRIRPSSGVVSEIQVGTRPTGLARAGRTLWVSNFDDHTVSRVDTGRNEVVRTIGLSAAPTDVTVGFGGVWIAHAETDTVSRIDLDRNAVDRTVEVGDGPTAVAAGTGAVWVALGGDGAVARIDPRTSDVIASIAVGRGTAGIAVGPGSVWATSSSDRTVSRIDPDSNLVEKTIQLRFAPTAIVVGAGAVWVAHPLDDRVSRIDIRTNAVTATIPVGDGPADLATGISLWVTNRQDRTVVRVNSVLLRVTRTFRVGASPSGIAIIGDSVWVAADDGSS